MVQKKRYSELKEDAINSLLALPLQNLESRIRFLEEAIAARTAIAAEIDDSLRSHIVIATDLLGRVRYSDIGGPLSEQRAKLQKSHQELEELRLRHLEADFRDKASLHEKLQAAREELRKVSEHRRLLDDSGRDGGFLGK